MRSPLLVEGKPFLGYVDKMGVSYTTDVVASGVGLYFALVCALLFFYYFLLTC